MADVRPVAADLDFDAIREGDTFQRGYRINPAVYEAFLATFGDHSPLHVDEAYARDRGFEGLVMHGSILNGFISHFVGMHVPGRRALLLSVDLHYSQPSYLGDQLTLHASAVQRVEAIRAVVLHVRFFNETRGVQVARGRVRVGFAW